MRNSIAFVCHEKVSIMSGAFLDTTKLATFVNMIFSTSLAVGSCSTKASKGVTRC